MKILVISNNPLVKENANGRSMLNMLSCFNKSSIFNFYINGNGKCIDEIHYYKINEQKMLKGFNFIKNISYINERTIKNTKKRFKKTSIKMIARSLLWNRKIIRNEFLKTAKLIAPDIIVIQTGDNDYLINVAIFLSKKLNVDLFTYNTEDYVFKTWDYIEKKDKMSLLFKLIKKRLVISYDKLFLLAKGHVFLTPSLEELYKEKYNKINSIVIYNSTNIISASYNEKGNIVYGGNTGVGRSISLIELSRLFYDKLGKKIHIYTDHKNFDNFKNCDTIILHNSVPYDDYCEIMKEASIIVHVESFDKYYLKDTKNAFSSKIADCLAINAPLFVYAPNTSFTFKYLSNNKCAIAVSNLSSVSKILDKMNESNINELLANAKKTVEKNHNLFNNSLKFYNFLKENRSNK